MIRLFIAMPVPYEVRKNIFRLIDEIIPDHSKYKWENIAKIHLTLKFIGNIEEKILPDLENKLSFIENYNKFHFRLTGFNFFYKNKNPQILWLGLGTEDPLKKLVKDIDETLTGFSVSPEKRDFKAHLTLMRIKKNPGDTFIEAFRNFRIPQIEFSSDEVILMQSLLKATGSEYKEIKVFKLK